MNDPTSTALVPLGEASSAGEKAGGCGGQRSLLAGRNKWFLIAAALLAVAALAFGSAWLGLAALLPLLYILPCLVMVAMCMRMHGKSNDSGSS